MFKHVKQLGVVYLEQHAGDLAGQVWVHTLDQWEQTLTQHLLLLLWWGSCQHCCSQRLLPLNVHSLEIDVEQLHGSRTVGQSLVTDMSKDLHYSHIIKLILETNSTERSPS